MNNNIHLNSQNYIKKNLQKNSTNSAMDMSSCDNSNSSQNMQSSAECLSFMGQTQVNLNNQNARIRTYLDNFKADEENATAMIEFQDSLIAQGVDYEKAIKISELTFKQLRNEKTYH